MTNEQLLNSVRRSQARDSILHVSSRVLRDPVLSLLFAGLSSMIFTASFWYGVASILPNPAYVLYIAAFGIGFITFLLGIIGCIILWRSWSGHGFPGWSNSPWSVPAGWKEGALILAEGGGDCSLSNLFLEASKVVPINSVSLSFREIANMLENSASYEDIIRSVPMPEVFAFALSVGIDNKNVLIKSMKIFADSAVRETNLISASWRKILEYATILFSLPCLILTGWAVIFTIMQTNVCH